MNIKKQNQVLTPEQVVNKLLLKLISNSQMSHKLTLEESNIIIQDFGRVYQSKVLLYLFPVDKPESLLPKQKNIIQEAFEVAYSRSNSEEDKNTLFTGYLMLHHFISDFDALEINKNLIMSQHYWTKILKLINKD